MAVLASRIHGAIHPAGHGTRVLATGPLPAARQYPDDVPRSACEAASPITLYIMQSPSPTPAVSTAHPQD